MYTYAVLRLVFIFAIEIFVELYVLFKTLKVTSHCTNQVIYESRISKRNVHSIVYVKNNNKVKSYLINNFCNNFEIPQIGASAYK